MSRKAFHILLANPLPCWHSASSKRRSLPAEEDRSKPTRTPSAPKSLISFNASGEFPKDFDIFRRSLSRTNPVRYTFEKGFSPLNSYPAIIIRATQKKRISGPVTKS